MGPKDKLIVGGTLGGLAAVILAVVLIWYFVLRPKKEDKKAKVVDKDPRTLGYYL